MRRRGVGRSVCVRREKRPGRVKRRIMPSLCALCAACCRCCCARRLDGRPMAATSTTALTCALALSPRPTRPSVRARRPHTRSCCVDLSAVAEISLLPHHHCCSRWPPRLRTRPLPSRGRRHARGQAKAPRPFASLVFSVTAPPQRRARCGRRTRARQWQPADGPRLSKSQGVSVCGKQRTPPTPLRSVTRADSDGTTC